MSIFKSIGKVLGKVGGAIASPVTAALGTIGGLYMQKRQNDAAQSAANANLDATERARQENAIASTQAAAGLRGTLYGDAVSSGVIPRLNTANANATRTVRDAARTGAGSLLDAAIQRGQADNATVQNYATATKNAYGTAAGQIRGAGERIAAPALATRGRGYGALDTVLSRDMADMSRENEDLAFAHRVNQARLAEAGERSGAQSEAYWAKKGAIGVGRGEALQAEMDAARALADEQSQYGMARTADRLAARDRARTTAGMAIDAGNTAVNPYLQSVSEGANLDLTGNTLAEQAIMSTLLNNSANREQAIKQGVELGLNAEQVAAQWDLANAQNIGNLEMGTSRDIGNLLTGNAAQSGNLLVNGANTASNLRLAGVNSLAEGVGDLAGGLLYNQLTNAELQRLLKGKQFPTYTDPSLQL